MGETVDSRDVKKHRNDIACMLQIMGAEANYDLPGTINADMQSFGEALAAQDDFARKHRWAIAAARARPTGRCALRCP